jgi:hypothetical protein
MSSVHEVDNVVIPQTSWLVRHNTVLTIGAACVAPIIYLIYVNHFAVNSFLFDDGTTFAAMNAALHGHLPLAQLWRQYTEGRQFLSNTIFVGFALIDRADVRSLLFVSAAVFIATYVLLLALFRQYLRTRLTPLPVLIIGLVWFSLADVGNSLFAYQLSLYLVVLSVIVMLFALLVPDTHRTLWFAVAVLAAIAASVSFIDGFLAWPLGVICILWRQSAKRRSQAEISIWVISMLCTGALYFSGYQASGCSPVANCSIRESLAHPVTMGRIFLTLLGGVLPSGHFAPNGYFGPEVHSGTRFEVVGAVLLAVAIYIIIQSWRNRSSRERLPLPMLLICLSLLWDALTTLGRTGFGVDYIIGLNRYIMPNLILLTAILMYAWAHRPPLRLSAGNRAALARLTSLPIVLLAFFVIIQVSVSTSFGMSNGRAVQAMFTDQARLWVNLNRVPARDRSCEVNLVIDQGLFTGGPPPQPAEDGLGEFAPNSYHYYRNLGPPPLSPSCANPTIH